MSDRSYVNAELDWTLGRVEIRRFDDGEQRTVLIRAPDYDMGEYGGETQAVCLEELDELIAALTKQRFFLSRKPLPPEAA